MIAWSGEGSYLAWYEAHHPRWTLAEAAAALADILTGRDPRKLLAAYLAAAAGAPAEDPWRRRAMLAERREAQIADRLGAMLARCAVLELLVQALTEGGCDADG